MHGELVILGMPGNEAFAKNIAKLVGARLGAAEIRSFPDGESYVRILSDVKGKDVLLVCTLDHPDVKFLPLYFLGMCLKNQGACRIGLIAPYLAYMRQDKEFNPGESVSSVHFAALISSFVDSLITIDPHLHRRRTLNEIYSIPNQVLHASEHILDWILNNVENPLLVGPDSESEQWVGGVSRRADLPFIVLEKTRRGDTEVEVSVPNVEGYRNHTPILIDDIISSGQTMIETINRLKQLGMGPPVCIGVHAVFAGAAFEDLKDAGAERIVTCNTIPHETNEIDLSDLVARSLIENSMGVQIAQRGSLFESSAD